MSDEFKEAKMSADFWRNDIMPYMHNRLYTNMPFEDYIKIMYKNTDGIYLDFIPYCYSLKFIERFDEKCVAYCATIVNNNIIKDVIYQISPSLHLLASVKYWRLENGDSFSGVVLVERVIYESKEEFLKFVDDNIDLVKQDEKQKTIGFAG